MSNIANSVDAAGMQFATSFAVATELTTSIRLCVVVVVAREAHIGPSVDGTKNQCTDGVSAAALALAVVRPDGDEMLAHVEQLVYGRSRASFNRADNRRFSLRLRLAPLSRRVAVVSRS